VIIDANDLSDGDALRSVVCIVGGGPVGIALALRLAALEVDTLLLEAGGTEHEDATEALYRGTGGGYGDLTTTRLQMLGGSTNHWGGQSRPLEPIDFEPQNWRRGSGWPIARDDALARLDEAIEFLGLAGNGWDAASWLPDEALLGDGEIVEKVFQGRPLSAGEFYEEALHDSERVTVVLHANVTRIRVDPATGSVSVLEIRTLDGAQLTATGEEYVLAAGGIESARLLLASTDDIPAGVGNGADLVGRYFADHHIVGPLPLVPGPAAQPMVAPSDAPEVARASEAGVTIQRALALSPEAQHALELPGFHAFLLESEPPFSDEVFARGVEGLVDLGGAGTGPIRAVVVGFEQLPNPESRVTLDAEQNAFGEPRARVDWQLTEDDQANMQRAIDLLARFLARNGIGRLRIASTAAEWRQEAFAQHHHMGTLRMGGTPSDGVVDPDLRFHDVANLYAVGTAVFPTYGHVNPTLNAVALTLRLADHLAQEVGA